MAHTHTFELTVTVHHEGDMFWAETPEYPGLFASGSTIEELTEAVAEAWLLYNHEEQPEAKARPAATTRSMSILVPA